MYVDGKNWKEPNRNSKGLSTTNSLNVLRYWIVLVYFQSEQSCDLSGAEDTEVDAAAR